MKKYQVATVLIWKVEADNPNEAFKKAIDGGENAVPPHDVKSYVNEIGPDGQLITVQHQPKQPKDEPKPEPKESKESKEEN